MSAPFLRSLKPLGFKKNNAEEMQKHPPRAPTPALAADSSTPREYPEANTVVPSTLLVPEASTGVEDPPLPSNEEQNPTPEEPSTSTRPGGPVVRAEVEPRSDTQLATTSHVLSAKAAGPPLHTYSADLTQAKAAWSALIKKSSNFDAIFKELELKASEEAKHIHADLSAEVIKLKRQHAKELEAAELRHRNSIPALQAQIDEMGQEQERLRKARDDAVAQEMTTIQCYQQVKEACQKKSQALMKKFEDAEARAKQHEKRASD